MSPRPILKKRANKLRKAMRRSLPAFIDPVAYLTDRRLAPTKRAARELIFDGRLRSESHKVGFDTIKVRGLDGKPEDQKIIAPVPAHLRSSLQVVA